MQQESGRSKLGPRTAAPPGIWLPPGFRFHPTDDELITFYLMKKVMNSKFCAHAIADVDLNKYEPWDLPDKANMGEKEWYFFSLRDRKYPTGLRTNRATEAGYWKATGKDRDIKAANAMAIIVGHSHQQQQQQQQQLQQQQQQQHQHQQLVGMKKTLVFYKGRAPRGEKTNWVMHEYRLEGKAATLYTAKSLKEEWVVCRVFQKRAVLGKKSLSCDDGHCSDGGLPSSSAMTPVDYYKESSDATSVQQQQPQPQQSHQQWNASSIFPLYSGVELELAKLLEPELLPPLKGTPTGFLACKLKACKNELYPMDHSFVYDQHVQQQQQQQQQHPSLMLQQNQLLPSDQLVNELISNRFLSEPSTAAPLEVDHLYAF